MNQEESEQNDIDGMEKGADPTDKVMQCDKLQFFNCI